MKNGYKKNKLQQIRGFCAVMEEGSILHASKKMRTAQSNVSLQISSLEKTVGFSLFKREKQRLHPTPEALRFYKVCKKTLSEVDFLFENAGATIKSDYDNMIKIAAHSYMLSHILPPYFKKMIELNSKVKFELRNIPYEEAMDLLEHGIIDLAIYPTNKDIASKTIEIKEFYKCKAAVIVSKQHPLAKVKENDINWNILAQYDFMTLGKGITAQGLKDAITTNPLNSRFDIRNGTWEICSGIVSEGLSISGADYQYLECYKKNSNLVIKCCPWILPEYVFYILQNKKSLMSKSSADFINLLSKKV